MLILFCVDWVQVEQVWIPDRKQWNTQDSVELPSPDTVSHVVMTEREG